MFSSLKHGIKLERLSSLMNSDNGSRSAGLMKDGLLGQTDFSTISDGILSDLAAVSSNLLGSTVTTVEDLGSLGRNSRVYKITDINGLQYAAKHYFNENDEKRTRLTTEFSCLSFLWESGERAIPQPVIADGDSGYAFYKFIDGNFIESASVTVDEIDQAVAFLARLKALANVSMDETADRKSLPLAAEACFSLNSIFENIDLRLNRLRQVPSDSLCFGQLRRYLNNRFVPALSEIQSQSVALAKDNGISSGLELVQNMRTLSPSDFGFHNALKTLDGDIAFVDFEYFGWDDPAKTASDFLLHPAMELSISMKKRFFAGILDTFTDDPLLEARTRVLYPLFGLKWCMILLNEFIPANLQRRRFAGSSNLTVEKTMERQLAKSENMLQLVMDTNVNFPY